VVLPPPPPPPRIRSLVWGSDRLTSRPPLGRAGPGLRSNGTGGSAAARAF
jgi:hypothetical protein